MKPKSFYTYLTLWAHDTLHTYIYELQLLFLFLLLVARQVSWPWLHMLGTVKMLILERWPEAIPIPLPQPMTLTAQMPFSVGGMHVLECQSYWHQKRGVHFMSAVWSSFCNHLGIFSQHIPNKCLPSAGRRSGGTFSSTAEEQPVCKALWSRPGSPTTSTLGSTGSLRCWYITVRYKPYNYKSVCFKMVCYTAVHYKMVHFKTVKRY